MTQPRLINVAGVFRDVKEAQRLGPIITAALRELDTLFNLGEYRIRLKRFVILPAGRLADTSTFEEWSRFRIIEHVWDRLVGEEPKPEEWSSVPIAEEERQAVWEESRGAFGDTIDPEKLIHYVLRTAKLNEEQPLIVIVDQKVTPPRDFAYIIGRAHGPRENWSVISTVTIDPLYWNKREEHPLALIKQRFRVACAALLGELLGLKECTEPACYMYAFPMEPEDLDGMVRIGLEHQGELPEVAGKGFSAPTHDPRDIQTIEDHPASKGWQALV